MDVDDAPRSAAACELGAGSSVVVGQPRFYIKRDTGVGDAGIIAQDIDEIGRLGRHRL